MEAIEILLVAALILGVLTVILGAAAIIYTTKEIRRE